MRTQYLSLTIVLLGTSLVQAFTANAGETSPFPFFAFCIDTHDSKQRSLPEQAEMLKELGYDGVGHLWLENIPERLASLDAAGLTLYQITVQVNIANQDTPYDPKLREILPLLKGRNVQICLLMGGMAPSDVSGDARAVTIIREIADRALDSGTKIILYPHVNDWLERVEDALRLVRQVERPNVGVMFNLCHWMKVDKEENLKPVLEAALPHLWAVSINGTDDPDAVHAGTGNWLQPLDQGSFDVFIVLDTLKTLGYSGPVGLQCWGIEGDAREHLARSMTAWKQLVARLNE